MYSITPILDGVVLPLKAHICSLKVLLDPALLLNVQISVVAKLPGFHIGLVHQLHLFLGERDVYDATWIDHITHVLQALHWLLVPIHAQFRVLINTDRDWDIWRSMFCTMFLRAAKVIGEGPSRSSISGKANLGNPGARALSIATPQLWDLVSWIQTSMGGF